jgi:hypothetical protein
MNTKGYELMRAKIRELNGRRAEDETVERYFVNGKCILIQNFGENGFFTYRVLQEQNSIEAEIKALEEFAKEKTIEETSEIAILQETIRKRNLQIKNLRKKLEEKKCSFVSLNNYK